MMHKFTFIFLAALVALLGLSTAVQAVPAEADAPQTNGARFARGLPPLAPAKGVSLILCFFIELAYSLRTALTVVKRHKQKPSPSARAAVKRMDGMSPILRFLIELAYSLRTTLTVVKRNKYSSTTSRPSATYSGHRAENTIGN